MDISAVMNIHELARNRGVKQRAEMQTKKDRTPEANSARKAQNESIAQQGNVKADEQARTKMIGGLVNLVT